MKNLILIFTLFMFFNSCGLEQSSNKQLHNKTAAEEQEHIEQNQSVLNSNQPSPSVTWSLERENLINRFKMMNDRSVLFYMYVFNYGVNDPIGHYTVNKVSSVNSQLTNPEQIVITDRYDTPGEFRGRTAHVVDSPQEDGSYGTNGNAVFGFTSDMIYIEHNMQYILSNVPLNLGSSNLLANVNVSDLEQLNKLLERLSISK